MRSRDHLSLSRRCRGEKEVGKVQLLTSTYRPLTALCTSCDTTQPHPDSPATMVRKLATQVPQAVTRLLQAQTITPPVWYQAYLEHPPQPLPPRRLAPVDLSLFNRSSSSPEKKDGNVTHRAKRAKTPKLKVPELRFQEDEIRRRFFMDFPFEAFRPVSLIEGQTIDEGRSGLVEGEQWTELRQRGEVPTVEE